MGLLRKISLGLLVAAVILLAIIMGGLRLAISNIDYFKSEIDYLLARDVSKGIVLSGIILPAGFPPKPQLIAAWMPFVRGLNHSGQ